MQMNHVRGQSSKTIRQFLIIFKHLLLMECSSAIDSILQLLLPAMMMLFEDEAEGEWPGGPRAKARRQVAVPHCAGSILAELSLSAAIPVT